MSNSGAEREGKLKARYERYRYLPVLTLLLLVTLAALAIRHQLRRPPRDLRLKLASYQAALELIPEHYPDIDQEELHRAAMRGLIEGIDDPYSRYMDPAQLRESDETVEGQFGGVGIQVSPANGQAVITDLVPGGAAEQTDMEPGSLIVRVDENPADDMAFRELISAIRGEPGTSVDITVRDPRSEEEKTFELERSLIDISPISWEILEETVGFVSLERFNRQTEPNLARILEEIREEEQIKALILDMRGNPGGLLEAAVQAADMFLTNGRIVGIKGPDGEYREKLTADESTYVKPEMPIVVLVDEESASAAELLAGALQDHKRATVIGARTVGKGAIDTVFGLPDGSGMSLKVATYTAGMNIEIENNGITPDIAVGELPPAPIHPDAQELSKWIQQYREAKTAQKTRALEFLQEKLNEQ